ncbi:MAG: EamA family transporter, partial [Desulfovibrio sp.]|nr:EamA family transporter [Desulfovibrio sp.]
RVTFVLFLVWALALFNGSPKTLFLIPRNVWLYLFLSAIATGLSWLCYFKALETGDVSAVAPLDKLSVPLTIIVAVAFLGEPLTWKVATGGALISAGVLILAL